MSNADWYRRLTWTPADAAEFAERLKRSRSAFHRAQYLRIQAHHLQEAGRPELTTAALTLLDQLIAECARDPAISLAHKQRAECLVDLGRSSEALDAYRAALSARRDAPGWQHDAHLGFAELVIALGRHDLYGEALVALDEFADEGPFPVQRYSSAASRALIAAHLGDHASAAAWARRAIAAADQSESPFPRHRDLGLVKSVDPERHRRVELLAGADPGQAG